jgi:hypothetical protein
MHAIEFTEEELEVLREVLRYKIRETEMEMFRTDTHDFKQMLKHRRHLLEHLLSKVSNVPTAA